MLPCFPSWDSSAFLKHWLHYSDPQSKSNDFIPPYFISIIQRKISVIIHLCCLFVLLDSSLCKRKSCVFGFKAVTWPSAPTVSPLQDGPPAALQAKGSIIRKKVCPSLCTDCKDEMWCYSLVCEFQFWTPRLLPRLFSITLKMHRKIFNQREKLQPDAVVLQQTHNGCVQAGQRGPKRRQKHELKIQLYCSEWKKEYKTILGT